MIKVFSKKLEPRWDDCCTLGDYKDTCKELLDIHEIPRDYYFLDARTYNETWGVACYLSPEAWDEQLQLAHARNRKDGIADILTSLVALMQSDYFEGCDRSQHFQLSEQFETFAVNYASVFGGTPQTCLEVARERGALVDMTAKRFDALYDAPEKPRKKNLHRCTRKKKKAPAPVPKQVRSEFDYHDMVPLPRKKLPAQPLGIAPLRRGIEQLWSARDARNVVEKANGEKAIVM